VIRLGELLVAAGALDTKELEQALRAQVVWGGRLGTNLIELGFLDLDELSRALGKQHGLPAALARHFERADPALQAQFSAELADRHQCVPLLRLAEGQVALASMDPLDDEALAEIAAALGVAPTDLVTSIAAEQRMRYQLERVYRIVRSARFLRSRGGTIPPFPQFGDFQDEADSEVEIPIDVDVAPDYPIDIDIEVSEGIAVGRADTDALAAAIEAAASSSTGAAPQPDGEPAGRDRRAYVKTLDEAAPAERPSRPALDRKREPSKPKKALGRLALRKVVMTPAGGIDTPPPAAAVEERESESLADAAKAIRRSPDRDRVAELVIDAMVRFAPCADAAMLFVIRGGSATGWKYFCRSGADQPELAVPMDQAGLMPKVMETGMTMRGKVKELGAIDARLLSELEPSADGELRELAVVPIAIAGKVLCLLAVATTADAQIGSIETIATSAGTAFARLMRDAGR
jgi:Type II secretion system (T2SS), protein E, N-terminal domain